MHKIRNHNIVNSAIKVSLQVKPLSLLSLLIQMSLIKHFGNFCVCICAYRLSTNNCCTVYVGYMRTTGILVVILMIKIKFILLVPHLSVIVLLLLLSLTCSFKNGCSLNFSQVRELWQNFWQTGRYTRNGKRIKIFIPPKSYERKF